MYKTLIVRLTILVSLLSVMIEMTHNVHHINALWQ